MDCPNREAKRKRATEELAAIRQFVNAWDPYQLIEMGAPEDEFDAEALEIHRVLRRSRINSENQLARKIAAIFRSQFGDRGFTPERCLDLAHRIWQWWQEREKQLASG